MGDRTCDVCGKPVQDVWQLGLGEGARNGHAECLDALNDQWAEQRRMNLGAGASTRKGEGEKEAIPRRPSNPAPDTVVTQVAGYTRFRFTNRDLGSIRQRPKFSREPK